MVRKKRQFIDFGFDPGESSHHFAVIVSEEPQDPVVIEERFTWKEEKEPANGKLPVIKIRLDQYRWDRIAESARSQFNKRIREAGHRSVSWKTDQISLLSPHFGKELTLLAWAIEDIDESLIPNAIANWTGLEPEERWWLYTTVNATFTKAEAGKDRGWRKAIKIAFSENPVPEMSGERFVEEPEPIKLPVKDHIPQAEIIAKATIPKKKKRVSKNNKRQLTLFENK